MSDEFLSRCVRCHETFFKEYSQATEPDEEGFRRPVLYKHCPECRPQPRKGGLEDVVDWFSRPMGERLSRGY